MRFETNIGGEPSYYKIGGNICSANVSDVLPNGDNRSTSVIFERCLHNPQKFEANLVCDGLVWLVCV